MRAFVACFVMIWAARVVAADLHVVATNCGLLLLFFAVR
jgi:hypothetical protein